MRGRTHRSAWLLITFMLIGLIAGSWLGDIFKGFVPILGNTKIIGLKPTSLELSVLTLNFGLLFKTNLAGIIGLILSVLIFTRL